MSRMRKEAIIHSLQLHFEQRHLLLPYKEEGRTRRMIDTLLNELSMFTMLPMAKWNHWGRMTIQLLR